MVYNLRNLSHHILMTAKKREREREREREDWLNLCERLSEDVRTQCSYVFVNSDLHLTIISQVPEWL